MLSFLLALMYSLPVSAQTHMGGGTGYMFPDTLSQIRVTGTIHIDSVNMMPLYFIDINNDANNDYILNFGPIWYSPNDSTTKPNDGDQVTIDGRLAGSGMYDTQMIIVYEVNGQFWRDSFDPIWNDFGHNTHMMGQHMGDCNGYIYGSNVDSPDNVELSGKALVDTTYFMNMYYLDTNNDGKPDYFLNFGPWWYEPESGAMRPGNNESINITGGKIESEGLPVVVVYQIDGKVWRDSTLFGRYFGGGWIRKNNNNDTIINPFDKDDFMMMSTGWHMGGMMNDSLFGRMTELNPYNIPNRMGENIIKGYEFGMFNAGGSNMMTQNGNCGGMMNFNSNGNFQFHFDEKQLQAYGMDKNTVGVKYWNSQSKSWVNISNAVVDLSTNTVTFSMNGVSSYYILTADKATNVNENESIPTSYSLEQNYPNPFNPSTKIKYTLAENGYVSIKVYDVLGREVQVLKSGYENAGNHSIEFNGGNLSSGVYIYRLTANGYSLSKKMLFMK